MKTDWTKKFTLALQGIARGTRGHSSFLVHVPAAIAVLITAGLLRCEAWQWCVLAVCIGLVLSLELVNSAIESLARGLCSEHNEHVGRALDIASGAVLVASLVAAAVGTAIFAMQVL